MVVRSRSHNLCWSNPIGVSRKFVDTTIVLVCHELSIAIVLTRPLIGKRAGIELHTGGEVLIFGQGGHGDSKRLRHHKALDRLRRTHVTIVSFSIECLQIAAQDIVLLLAVTIIGEGLHTNSHGLDRVGKELRIKLLWFSFNLLQTNNIKITVRQ